MTQTAPEVHDNSHYGLRGDVLSPMETLAQSVSTIAPTTTPAATIPLVCALAGNGTWLAYALATSPCSRRIVHRPLCASLGISGFVVHLRFDDPAALVRCDRRLESLLAYVATGIECYRRLLPLRELVAARRHGPCLLCRVVGCVRHCGIDLDCISRHKNLRAAHALDRSCVGIRDCDGGCATSGAPRVALGREQLHLHGMTGSGLRLGLVLALFSFVGFESATTLGSEARNPLKTIPRAVVQSAILAGAFFTICAYAEVLGFHTAGQDLGVSQDPMHVVARVGGVPVLGLLIDIGALVSLFACTLSCITAAARVLLLMAHNGLAHDSLRATHAKNQTPSRAVVITGSPRSCRLRIGMPWRERVWMFMAGWVRWPLTVLLLPTRWFASPCRATCAITVRSGLEHKSSPGWRRMAMLLALVGNLYPVPEGPYGKLPFVYLAYLTAGLLWFVIRRRNKETALAEI